MLQIIGGKHRKRKLNAPKTDLVRPTASRLREAVFNICQHQIEGARFLDLFAGSGAMGLEALSRGAAHATFVEQGRQALQTMKQNIALLKEEKNTKVILADVLKIVPKLHEEFDLIYVDPPYGQGLGGEVLALLDSYPILAEGGVIFIEDSHLEAPPLESLALRKERQVGRAHLFEYV